jgi:hypothetical protein
MIGTGIHTTYLYCKKIVPRQGDSITPLGRLWPLMIIVTDRDKLSSSLQYGIKVVKVKVIKAPGVNVVELCGSAK